MGLKGMVVVAAVVTAVSLGFGVQGTGGAAAAECAGFPEKTRSLKVKHEAGKAIEIRTNNGNIDVRAGGTDTVQITATITAGTEERLTRVKVKAERDEQGALVIGVEWPDGKAIAADGAAFDVKVPSVDGVTAITENGAVTITGLGGPATLESRSGAIEIRDHKGSVTAKTTNGRVKATDVTGSVDVKTSNGAVELLDIGGAVRAETVNGAATVRTTDANKGPVRMETSNGTATVDVGSAFAGELSASTSIGKVTVEVAAPARVVEQKPTSARVKFGTAGESSSVKTSNGAITVRQGGRVEKPS
jgi:DUF4097 and DUF4098 domain-containing protein YvlB